METKYNKYLPIGSVVLLNEATKRLMITGYCVKTEENPDKIFDYCGCIYPEGMLSSTQTAVFDHNQIKSIFAIGYNDEECEKFIEILNNKKNN